MATRKRYTTQEKAKALQAVRASSVGAVASRTGIPKARLYDWQRSASQDEDLRDTELVRKHGDKDIELTPEMEAEASSTVALRRAEAELLLAQDEYEALKNKYIDLAQTVKSA